MEEGRVVSEYTQDGTVDLKGKPVLKSKRGGWKACSFVVGNSLSLFVIILVCLNSNDFLKPRKPR